MKNFFRKIGDFLKNNYWLQPLLLVALVFVLVFSLSGFENVISTVKGWFDPDSVCKNAERVRVTVAMEKLESIKDGEKVYVYYYDTQAQKEGTYEANHQLNIFVKAYNKDLKAAGKEEVTLYAVNYAFKELGEVSGEITKWADKKMTKEIYEEISEKVRLYYTENDPELVSGYGINDYVITCPIIVEYSYSAEGYVVTNTIKESRNFTQANLKSFFNGTYQG